MANSAPAPQRSPASARKNAPKTGRRAPGARPVPPEVLETVELLNDLVNYVGVGTLRLEMPRRAAPGLEARDDWLWLEPPAMRMPKGGVEGCLQELAEKHHIVRCTYKMVSETAALVRVYVLPEDVGRSVVSRAEQPAKRLLRKVLEALDVSEEAWEGRATAARKLLVELDKDGTSLFYMFNTLRSPDPNPNLPWMYNEEIRRQIRRALNPKFPVPGLKAQLYEYQRRSFAMMLQRELAPGRSMDPRLRRIAAPGGEQYFMDLDATRILSAPTYFDNARGGILAEEMGAGKTLICLALILFTKNHFAHMPERASPTVKHDHPPSLMDVCTSVIWRNGVPWRDYRGSGLVSDACFRKLEETPGFYEVPVAMRSRSNRYTGTLSGAMERIYLGSGTIVVCPPNLTDQWRSEISKHVHKGALKVLVLAHANSEIPNAVELLKYDVVIFSRTRFEKEEREGRDALGRREPGGKPLKCSCLYVGATRTPDCTCFRRDAIYKSPLMSIRWKRLIVDEGHSMGSGKSNAVCVAERLPVDCRWIVSGTPSSGLLGVTAGLSLKDGESLSDMKEQKRKLLEDRREFQSKEVQDLGRLGRIVRDFLQLQPWSSTTDKASWNLYITKGFCERRPGSAVCVRNIIQQLVIRHTPEDLEKSVALPPLYHNLILLEPGYHEKMAINVFLGALAVNAVTSEREDQDYMFHPSNRRQLRLLVNNMLKQSGFYWSNFSRPDVEKTFRIAQNHLEKSQRYNINDINLLRLSILTNKQALDSPAWNIFSSTHEMGIYVEDMPSSIAEAWRCSALDRPDQEKALGQFSNNEPLLMGAGHVLDLQKAFNALAYEPDIVTSICSVGPRVRQNIEVENSLAKQKLSLKNEHLGVPASSMTNGKLLSLSSKDVEKKHTKPATEYAKSPQLKSALKSRTRVPTLPDSPLSRVRVLGTSSRKLTYLLNSVLKHYKTEKSLIFYESEDVAYYIAQALEIVGIEYLAYGKSLSGQKKAQYIVTFHEVDKFRVLLMDLSQASHGLNICTASRVYFVNAVWTPSIEAQALKRAHRIGQTRPVHVETLALRGTLEEEMIRRRDVMTDNELKETSDNVVNDSTMRDIISNLPFLGIEPTDWTGLNQIARLDVPQGLFGEGKTGGVHDNPEDSLVGIETVGYEDGTQKPGKRARLSKADASLPKQKNVRVMDDNGEPEGGAGRPLKIVRFG